jgi:hypothetical protein
MADFKRDIYELLVTITSYSTNNKAAVVGIDSQRAFVAWGTPNPGEINGCFIDTATATVGDEFYISNQLGSKGFPTAAKLPNDKIVVLWQNYNNTNTDIYGQLVNATDGSLLKATPFLVNSMTNGDQALPYVAGYNTGFTAVWESDDGDSTGIKGRSFDLEAVETVPEFQVNNYTISSQNYPTISCTASATCLTAYLSDGNPNDAFSYSVMTKIFNGTDNSIIQDENVVNATSITYAPLSSSFLQDGLHYVVTWSSLVGFSASNVFGSLLDIGSTNVLKNFKINKVTNEFNFNAFVTKVKDGFGIAFESYHDDGSKTNCNIYTQLYAQNGTEIGNNTQVNTYIGSLCQYQPTLTEINNNTILPVWVRFVGTNADDNDIFARVVTTNSSTNNAVTTFSVTTFAATTALSTTNEPTYMTTSDEPTDESSPNTSAASSSFDSFIPSLIGYVKESLSELVW